MDNSYHGGTAYSNNSNSNDSLYNLDSNNYNDNISRANPPNNNFASLLTPPSNNDSTESNYSDTSFKMV
jgi:hypothetical protein